MVLIIDILNSFTTDLPETLLLRLKRDKAMEVERASQRRKAIQKSRSKRFRQPAIQRAIYGKEVNVKLTYTVKLSSAGDGIVKDVFPLVATLQLSNDWANYAQSFQNFNITRVRIQYILGGQNAFTYQYSIALIAGMCYSGKDSAALTNVNQIADHTNYTLFSTVMTDTTVKRYFKFTPRPKIRPPQQTGDATENFGWVKVYSNNINSTGVHEFGYFIFTFHCTFSGEA